MKLILIVEDQPEVARLLEVILKRPDRRFCCVSTGERALCEARDEKPDLILLDIMMPGGMDGYEVAKHLRNDPKTEDCPIIAMTAKTQERDREKAFACGVNGFIGKPFDLNDVRHEVDRYLSQ